MAWWRGRAACLRGFAVLGLCVFVCLAPAFAARPGVIAFSDGESLEGSLSIGGGGSLRLHVDTRVLEYPLERVAVVRFVPAREAMERPWRFREAGRTEKEFLGDPYPVRHLTAHIVDADGGSETGSLYTVALYVETSNATRKVVLAAKQRGTVGQAFEDLVYPSEVRFHDAAAPPATLVLDGARDDVAAGAWVALTVSGLFRFPGVRNSVGDIVFPHLNDSGVFVAWQSNGVVRVGWPGDDPEARALVSAAMPHVRDFFDSRELLAAWSFPPGGDLYSVKLLRRSRAAVGAPPWRVGVWRWVRGEDGRLLLAGRGYFFRGLLTTGGAPVVRLCPELWRATQTGARVVLPGEVCP